MHLLCDRELPLRGAEPAALGAHDQLQRLSRNLRQVPQLGRMTHQQASSAASAELSESVCNKRRSCHAACPEPVEGSTAKDLPLPHRIEIPGFAPFDCAQGERNDTLTRPGSLHTLWVTPREVVGDRLHQSGDRVL